MLPSDPDWVKYAKVGDRVVCINDDWGWIRYGEFMIPTRVPMISEILTIASIWPLPHGVFLVFVEIAEHQEDGGFGADVRWGAENFRPLIERPTDISVFTAMLDHEAAPTWATEPEAA